MALIARDATQLPLNAFQCTRLLLPAYERQAWVWWVETLSMLLLHRRVELAALAAVAKLVHIDVD